MCVTRARPARYAGVSRGVPQGRQVGVHDFLGVAGVGFQVLGDGLVAQIPSLLLSVAAALIVTRVGSAGDMGGDVKSQLFENKKIFFSALMSSLFSNKRQ